MERILFVSFSQNNGNTNYILNQVLDYFKKDKTCNNKIEFINLKNKDIKQCNACFYCKNNNNCMINDNMQKLYDLLIKNDIIVIFTPIYFSRIPGFSKTFIDRTNALYYQKSLKNKKLIVVAIGGNSLKYSKNHLKVFFRLFSNAHKMIFKKIFFFSYEKIDGAKKDNKLKSKILKISSFIQK
jgi:multimeric flavodoxin WrbA